MKLFLEAPPGTDHWQPAAPSAPAKQHGLGPPLFPTERPSLFWTHASAERWGGMARSALWGGLVVHACECMCDVLGAAMISLSFVVVCVICYSCFSVKLSGLSDLCLCFAPGAS